MSLLRVVIASLCCLLLLRHIVRCSKTKFLLLNRLISCSGNIPIRILQTQCNEKKLAHEIFGRYRNVFVSRVCRRSCGPRPRDHSSTLYTGGRSSPPVSVLRLEQSLVHSALVRLVLWHQNWPILRSNLDCE